MDYTGFAGEIVGWVILIMAYGVILSGILSVFCLVYWLLVEVVIRNIVKQMGIYRDLYQFFVHRKEFMAWLKRKKGN